MKRFPSRRGSCAAALLLSACVLPGCTSFSPDGGFDRVRDVARSRLGRELPDPTRDAGAIDRRIAALLAEPLGVDAAVEVALLSNRELRATYRDLGIAEADLVQAGRLPNPGIDFRHTSGRGFTVIERTFVLDFAALLTLPLATRIERSRFDEVQLEVADAMLRTAAKARRAWIDAVAAGQRVRYARQVVDASDAAADLAGRMRAAGNWSALAAARERSFEADAVAELSRATRTADARREALTRQLGLAGEASTYRLAERLEYLRELETRRVAVLDSIRGQGVLTDALEAGIARALTKAELEDLYLPFKPKRRTKAMIARENGLGPLAAAISERRAVEPAELAAGFVTGAVPDAKAALEGARDIIAEGLSEDAGLLARLRAHMKAEGRISSSVVAGKEAEGAKFSDYFAHSEAYGKVAGHRVLAMLRGRNEGFLSLDLEVEADAVRGTSSAERMCAGHL